MTADAPDLEALLAAMTLEEKLGQLTMVTADMARTGPSGRPAWREAVEAGAAGSVFNLWGREAVAEAQRAAVQGTRLGIPLFFGLDVIHGHRTIFPVPLAEAGAFDPALWARTARAAATEAAADGIDLTFAPMLDVCRDPRWGRIVEGPGEDALVAARFAAARVAGLQGEGLDAPDALAATAKHFGAYGAVLAGRDYASADVSDRLLREVYFPPFRAAVAAGVAAVMPSFNDLAGVPMTANRMILRGLLRDGWGFDGVIVSDYGAIAELVAHGIAADLAGAAARALAAGVDIDMMGEAYLTGLPGALHRGLAEMADIDGAVRRVLALKAALGLFEDPYRRCRGSAKATARPAVRALAREAATRSIVLLKNAGPLLPIDGAVRRIAVAGPLAAARDDMTGPWWAAGEGAGIVPLLDGIRAAFPGAAVDHEPGVLLEGEATDGIAAAVAAASAADVALLCLGEGRLHGGEAASRGRLDLPGRQQALAEAVLATGTPTVLLLTGSRPLAVPALLEAVDAALMLWFPGSEAGHAVGDLLSGQADPSARLAVSWPVDEGQIPIHFSRRPTGRPPGADKYTAKYLDLPTEPLFPFGHGLGYARAGFMSLTLDRSRITAGEGVTATVELANAGDRPAEETVFVFLRDPVASIARPLLELVGFSRALVPPGARVRVTVPVAPDAFGFLDETGERVVEPGTFHVLAGPVADAARCLSASLTLDAAGTGLTG